MSGVKILEMGNKYLIIILSAIFVLLSSCRQKEQTPTLRAVIEQQIATYPESRLQDVYKSFYQDHFGPGHMITDTESVRRYLYMELSENDVSSPIYYEPTGCEGRFVRVFLSSVADSLISADELTSAFVRSANEFQEPQSEWITEWREIVRTIHDNRVFINGFEADEPELTKAAQNNQTVHHSPAYNAAYHPHYRIVRRDIFEKEIKPKLVR